MPLKRGRSENDVIVLPTEENGALDKFGVFTFSTDLDTVAFVKDLRECSALWFNENLEKMLADPPKSMFFSEKYQTKYEDVVKGKAKWDSLSPEEQKSIKAKFDLCLDSGMQWVFVTGSLKKEPWFEALECKDFLQKAISFVRMGNVAMGLANMAQAWTAKGFGLWAHLIPDFGLLMVEDTMQRMIDLGFEVGKPQHFPHPIYKPPDGAALEVHHDQMAPSDLLRHLKEHVDSEDPSTTAWVKRHGIQLLAHLTGGTGTEDGATFIIGPMTPKKLLICLSFYAEGGAGAGSGYEDWLAKPRGKIDLPWMEYLEVFNLELSKKGEAPIGRVPASPKDRSAHDGGFVLGWPVGWPHGSFKNSPTEDPKSGKGSRITMTVPISMNNSTQAIDPRIPMRLEMLGLVSSPGRSDKEYADAEQWLKDDTEVYADGSTHKNPQKIVDLVRHPDAAAALGKTVGPFHKISIQYDTAVAYNAIAAPMAVPMPAPSESLLAEILSTDVRLIKVKQPWADALVSGQKNVENRRWPLTPKSFPVWLFIVSSKSLPTAGDLEDYNRRLDAIDPRGRLRVDVPPNEYALQKIVGVVKLLGCYAPTDVMMPPAARDSVWYNRGDDHAWLISPRHVYEFDDPISLNKEDAFQTQSSLQKSIYREEYIAAVASELKKLDRK